MKGDILDSSNISDKMKNELAIKLENNIKILSKIEMNDSLILFAIFNKLIEENIEKRVTFIKNDLQNKMNAYNVKSPKIDEEIEKLVEQYKKEFEKIAEQFKNRYKNVQIELQEIELNQKIALANFSKIMEKKNIASTKKLANKYEIRANECIERFNSYNELINECLIEFNICKKEFLEELEKVVIISDSTELIEKQTTMQLFVYKLKTLFLPSFNFRNNVILKKENELKILESQDEELIKNIKEKTINFVATIGLMRKKINQKFVSIMG